MPNPNVMFEYGYAKAFIDSSIIISISTKRSTNSIPFDISKFRYSPINLGDKDKAYHLILDYVSFSLNKGWDKIKDEITNIIKEWNYTIFIQENIPEKINDLQNNKQPINFPSRLISKIDFVCSTYSFRIYYKLVDHRNTISEPVVDVYIYPKDNE